MSGHVFHPGHHDLHGITVVLETTGDEIYVGRFDSQDETGVHLIGVSIYTPRENAATKAEFLAHTAKFGVRVDRPHLVVPTPVVSAITPLGTMVSG